MTVRLFFDTETTGLPDFKLPADHPSQPRMVQLAMVLGRLTESGDGFEYMDRFEGIIRPDGWTVPEEVARIHGLTTEICVARGVPVAEALERYEAFCDRADELLAYGMLFDSKILRGELRRANRPDRFGTKPELCVLRAATEPCKMAPTSNMMAAGRRGFKAPKLGEAHEILLGHKMKNAHDAMADVEALIAVWRHLHGRGLLPAAKVRESLPEDQRPGRVSTTATTPPAPHPPIATASDLSVF